MKQFRYITLLESHTLLGVGEFDVFKDPETGEIFITGDNGGKYRCQQDIDMEKSFSWIISEEDYGNNNFNNIMLVNRDIDVALLMEGESSIILSKYQTSIKEDEVNSDLDSYIPAKGFMLVYEITNIKDGKYVEPKIGIHTYFYDTWIEELEKYELFDKKRVGNLSSKTYAYVIIYEIYDISETLDEKDWDEREYILSIYCCDGIPGTRIIKRINYQ